jgi:hypothetical protein
MPIANAIPVLQAIQPISPKVLAALDKCILEAFGGVSLIDFFDEMELFKLAPPMPSLGYHVEVGEKFFESWEIEYAEPSLKSIGLSVLRWEGKISNDNTRHAVIEVNNTIYHLVY